MRTHSLTALALCAALAACSKPPAPAPGALARAETAVPVLLRPVRTQAVQVEVPVNGTLWADEDVGLSAKVSGRVLEVQKDLGDRLGAGELLARIDPLDYALAVEQKDLAVKESLAKVGLKELPGGEFDPATVPVVQRARLQAENAESKFQRTKQLFEQQPPRVTAQEHDDARTEAAVARSNHDVELLNARAQVDEARTRAADLAIARQHLADTEIRAPAGRRWAVAERSISAGEYLREGTALYRLVDDARIKLRAPVPERYANEIAVGQTVRVTVESSSEEFSGRVARISPQIDPRNRSFEVEIHVPNERGLLHPGAFAHARIQTRLDPRVVFVPQEALISFAGVHKVFVVEDGKARAIEVEPGDRAGDWIAVRTGLAGSESVVVSGNSKLATGTAVAAEVAGEAR
jgi:multidrug efflux pump subunit AcrA (membrane-fusion protein)